MKRISRSGFWLHLTLATWLVIVSAPCSAFGVLKLNLSYLPDSWLNGQPWHEIITEEGLNAALVKDAALIRRTGKPISFSPSAVGIIRAENAATDSTNIWDASVHFDDERFVEASSALIALKGVVVEEARKGNYDSAQRYLGFALHTLQDFYAHSTWVERNGSKINAALGNEKIINPPVGQNTCNSNSIDASIPLTTGYFWVLQLGGNSSYSTKIGNPPAEKCIHGSGKFKNDSNLGDIKLGAGINKDNENRTGFYLAKKAAVDATSAFVAEIITSLAGNDDAICGFLDQADSDACRRTYITKFSCNQLAITNPNWVYEYELLAEGTVSAPDVLSGFDIRVAEASLWDYYVNVLKQNPLGSTDRPIPLSCPQGFSGGAYFNSPINSPYHDSECKPLANAGTGIHGWKAQFSHFGKYAGGTRQHMVGMFDTSPSRNLITSRRVTCPN